MKAFTNLYQVAKTLRFELIPDERTKEFLEHSKLIDKDEHRAESYVAVKGIIDRYHKAFIERVLSELKLQYAKEDKLNSLEELYSLYMKTQKSDADKKMLEQVQSNLRKQIANALTKDSQYKRMSGKELIREDLFKITTPEERTLVEEFADFTTYFSGFYENRKNMYSAEAQSTAISYRLINENLPKFIDNIATFHKILNSPVAEQLPTLYKEMEEYLNVNSIEEMFMLDYYDVVLTQTQIEVYNGVIGGRTTDDGQKIQGINEYVNLFNQKQSSRETRLPKLKPLFKQILSDRQTVSWLTEEFKTDREMLAAIKERYDLLSSDVFPMLKELLQNLSSYDLNQIFIPNNLALTDISQSLYGDWGVIKREIMIRLKHDFPQTKKEKAEKYEERIEKTYKSFDSFSIAYLNEVLSEKSLDVCSYFATLGAVNNKDRQTENLFLQIKNAYHDAAELFEKDYPETKNLAQDKQSVDKLKVLMDAMKALQHFVKPLMETGEEPEKDERFYGDLSVLMEELNLVTPLYNKVRNRMTRKPYSNEKFKLTFNIKGNFLGGWVDSKTEKSDNGTQYGGYLFRKKNSIGEYDYYLGVSANTKLFRKVEGASGQYERLDYYQPKSQTVYGNSYVGKDGYESDKQTLMHSIISYVSTTNDMNVKQQVESKDTPSAMITVIKDDSPLLYQGLLDDPYFSDVNRRVTNNLHKTILSMTRIPRSKDYQDAKFTLFTEPQQVIEDICKEKVFGYFAVDDQEIADAMADTSKPFLLFKISNKDLSFAEKFEKGMRHSRGMDNLHTMYFKALMNGEQSVLDIGSGEVFFRRASIKANITHPARIAIKNKNNANEKKESCFDYDLIKDKRYTVDKFGFHLSIIQNYQSPNRYDVNALTREYIRNNPDVHFIGIDRGERHLLYVSVINSRGQIVEQFSMNKIENEYNQTDYHQLLEQRSDIRQKERQSWRTIEGIKELKQGYLSQVVHRIATLMVKYKAVVVLEDLNMGFKRGRQMVESSVYQQFEKALIDKLNYLVDKQVDANEPGGLLRGLQFTNKFTSFREMGKQNGFLFYIPAWNTSKMDPVTGFVDLLHPRYENVDKARAFFCKFKSIQYNDEKGWYEFHLDYNDFNAKAEGTKTLWTVCSNGTRIETFRNVEKNSSWDNREVCLTEEFDTLFADYHISRTGNLKEQIAQQTEKSFFERLTHLLNLTLQMRNSMTGTTIDYLVSPVADEDGVFYDSRTCSKELPENADANGAYNIARKGLWVACQIREAQDANKVKLNISNKQWLLFAQTKPYLSD